MERHHFESEMQALKNRLLNMGALVEERVHRAIQALMERNLGSAEEIAHGDQDVNELLNEATVFVQTSTHEGFCLPPLEAMATGEIG